MKASALIALGALIVGCANPAQKDTETTAQEKDWEVLFDGTSTDKWKQYNGDTMSEAWKIEDGALVFYPPKKDLNGEKVTILLPKKTTTEIGRAHV